MSTKFEQLLDLLVNEEMDKANELFHEIVVEKSREIYENMIAEEAEEDDEEMDEASEEDEDESIEEETTLEIGGDETDDMVSDIGDADAMGDMDDGSDMAGDIGDDSGEGTEEERISDLEDALEELKAEFEALMADEQNEPAHDDGEEDPDFGGEDDGEEADDEEEGEEDEDETMGQFESRQMTREYREKVGNDWDKNSMKTPGPVGSGKGELAGQTSVSDTRSPVSSAKGRPTTGATAHNILGNGGKTEGTNTGTSPNADKGSRGLVGATKGEFTKGVEKNISSSSSSSMKSGSATSKQGSGYPGNNKSAGPVGSGTGDKAGQTSVGVVKSPLNGAPSRNA
jgi:hypothetical protein